MTIELRPLTEGDVTAATTLTWTEISRVMGDPGSPPDTRTPDEVVRSEGRVRHLIGTDPDGSWGAFDADALVGVSMALRRGPLWFLSLLAVAQSLQAAGTGKRLLAAAEQVADGAGAGLITSSSDPRALRRYALAGFALLPTVTLKGVPAAHGTTTGVRDGDWARDAGLVEDVVTRLRGTGYGPDVTMLAQFSLLVVDGPRRGYAVHTAQQVVALGADDPATAADLLTEVLRRSAEEVTVRWVTGDQQWAVRAGLAAGLAVLPGSAVCTRGEVGPLAPYLVNGAYG